MERYLKDLGSTLLPRSPYYQVLYKTFDKYPQSFTFDNEEDARVQAEVVQRWAHASDVQMVEVKVIETVGLLELVV